MATAKRKELNSPKSHSQIELITPKMAQEILSKNTNNRPLNKRDVEFYQTQIERGLWDLNGESIKIASDGTLIDGQHRLEAISRSGIPTETYVVRNLSKGVFTTIDNGKRRTHADYLSINGVEGNHKIIAAAARIAMGFKKDGSYIGVSGKMIPDDVVSYVDRHPQIVDSEQRLSGTINKIFPVSIAVGLHYIFSLIDEHKTEEFFTQLIDGTNLHEGSPVLALRNRLISCRGSSRAGVGYRRMLVYMVVHAFNAFMKKKKMQTIQYQSDFQISLDGFKDAVLTNWK